MPAPIVSGLTISFPANSKYIIGKGFGATVIPIVTTSVTLDACTAGTETDRIYWKQGVAAAAFVNCPSLSWVGRTAISNVSVALVGGGAGANVQVMNRGMVYTTDVVANPLQQADVTTDYKQERYDLLEVDLLGVVHVVKGVDDGFAASEFLPVVTPGRYPLFNVYLWNDTAEVIDANSWIGTTPRNRLAIGQIAALRAYNQSKLTHVLAKIASKSAINIAGYGDSITAVGGGWNASGGADDTTWLDLQSDNKAGYVTRDSSGFVYWHTPSIEAKYSPLLGNGWPQPTANVQLNTWGWGYALKAAVASLCQNVVNWKNWGIGGTSSGTGVVASGAPNGGDATRLGNLNGDTFDLVIYNFSMNDFVGFATSDLNTPLANNIAAIQAAHPNADIVLMGAPGINSENTNPLAWLRSCEARYLEVARALGCGFVPTYMVTFDGPGYLGISREHYAGANRYNHEMPYELAKYGAWLVTALGF